MFTDLPLHNAVSIATETHRDLERPQVSAQFAVDLQRDLGDDGPRLLRVRHRARLQALRWN